MMPLFQIFLVNLLMGLARIGGASVLVGQSQLAMLPTAVIFITPAASWEKSLRCAIFCRRACC